MVDFAKESIADYTADASGTAEQFAEVYRPAPADSSVMFPVLIEFQDAGGTFDGFLKPERTEDALAYQARSDGFLVVRASYRSTTAFPAPEDDAATVVQHLRDNAATWQLDPTRITVYGRRRGANAAAWAALGPDQATGSGQTAQSSRVRAAILSDCVANWPSMVQATTSGADFGVALLSSVAGATQDLASPAQYWDQTPLLVQPRVFLLQSKALEAGATVPAYPLDSIVELGSEWHGQVLLDVLALVDVPGHTYRARLHGVDVKAAAKETQTHDWALWEADRLPVEELVIRAVEDVLRSITHENGYTVDVQAVYRYEDLEAAVHDYPSIMVTALNTSYNQSEFSNKTLGNLRLGLTLLQGGLQRQLVRGSVFLADVRGALDHNVAMENRPLGTGTPFLTESVESGRFADEADGHSRSGATVVLSVSFRETIGDPYDERG